MNILHGLTGSVASKISDKFGEVYDNLGYQAKLIYTSNAKNFCSDLRDFDQWYNDADEWNSYKNNGTVLHIDLVKWADAFLIAPCSANTLAKIANGICDNLLTCIARAWNFDRPFIIAPAMNTQMWNHPITKEHIDKIKNWGIKVINPVEKKLFCGDTGIGAMENIEDIINFLQKTLTKT